ncbi:replication initiation protein [Paraburkholderia sediminicola]|uniref:replication initiation protein n=1 Tax=Paraburkholderia sediminicola TaxID=458836 RepID=UPI0038BAF50C
MGELQTSTKDLLVKKHAGAIHIKNDISCLQRKVWNVLLRTAYDDLPDTSYLDHRIPVKDLCEYAGFDSKNTGYLKQALEDLVKTPLTWNIIDEKGKHEWGVSTALAGATIKEGFCTYAYSPMLRQKLYNPEFYANIDMLILRRFSSGHALALYENAVRYRGVGQTPNLDLLLLRDLLGVGSNASYDEFKIFNRAVVQPAIKEINQVSDISIEMEMTRERRKVVALRFKVRENNQSSLPIEVDSFNVSLQRRLQEDFSLTERQAKDVLVTHSEDRIEAVMRYVGERYQGGLIQQGKIAPYFLKVVKDGDIPMESSFDRRRREDAEAAKKSANSKTRAEELQSEFAANRAQEIRAAAERLSEIERLEVETLFEANLHETRKSLVTYWNKHRFASKLIVAEFNKFIEERFLPPREDAYKAFVASRA